MKKLILVACVAAFSVPALAADECTEERAKALSDQIFGMIDKDPSLGEKLDGYVAEVEKDYGGEPSEAQICEALEKLVKLVEAGG